MLGGVSDEQEQAVGRVRQLNARERALRAELEDVRVELRRAVAAALDDHGVPLARLAREIDRDRPALYRWREEGRQARAPDQH